MLNGEPACEGRSTREAWDFIKAASVTHSQLVYSSKTRQVFVGKMRAQSQHKTCLAVRHRAAMEVVIPPPRPPSRQEIREALHME